MLKFINLISGSGSTNLAIIEAENPGGRLFELTKTVAIISSDPKAKPSMTTSARSATICPAHYKGGAAEVALLGKGIKKAIKAGFLKKDIFVVDPKKNLAKQILKIFDRYQPDYFHQLGWMPLTPREVIARYKGINQHFGPGGKWMYGVRRIYAHIVFCQKIGEWRPIPVFCQRVASEYDKGNVIYVRYEEIKLNETAEQAAKRLLTVEHQVQIEARFRLAINTFQEEPVPKIAKNSEEEKILFEAIKQARNKYPAR